MAEFSIEEASKKLIAAALAGDLGAVKKWLPMGDPKAQGSVALYLAAGKNHEAVVRLLLPFSNPKDGGSRALQIAAENGNLAIARLLIPVSDVNGNRNEALQCALSNDDPAMIEALIPGSDVEAVWEDLLRDSHFRGLDPLVPYVPQDRALSALERAPKGSMPRAAALKLRQTLSSALTISVVSPAVVSSKKSRI